MPLFNMSDVDRILASEDPKDPPKKVLPKAEPFIPIVEDLGNQCIAMWNCINCQQRYNCVKSIVAKDHKFTRETYHTYCKSFQEIEHWKHANTDAMQFFTDCEKYPHTERSLKVALLVLTARTQYYGNYRVLEVKGKVRVDDTHTREFLAVYWRPTQTLIPETTVQCTLQYKPKKYKSQSTAFSISGITELVDDPRHPRVPMPAEIVTKEEPKEEKKYDFEDRERELF